MPDRICAYPGCDVAVWPRGSSGVCRSHTHSMVCRCRQCLTKRAAAPAPPAAVDPSTLRKVEVTYATGNSGILGRAHVTLQTPPWERNNA